jgi:monoterpene epsilon-lactone hydrolase
MAAQDPAIEPEPQDEVGWRRSLPGQTTAAETLGFCLRALRAEYNGEAYPEGVETLCDVRIMPGTQIKSIAPGAPQEVVVPWTREGSPPRGECEWVVPRAIADTSRRILFCCGGGYTGCRPADYRGMVSRIAMATGLACFTFDYRKAPEHVFPAAIDDAFSAFLWAIEHGPDSEPAHASEIVVMGDSAGGGLALAICLRLHRLGLAKPPQELELPSDQAFRTRLQAMSVPHLRLVTISAYSDLTCSGESYSTRTWNETTKKGDVCFSSGSKDTDLTGSRKWAQQYASSNERHPECSPYYALPEALASLPSTLMIVGEEELMLSETTDLAKRAADVGANVTLTVYPGMWHVFPMYSEACAMPGEGIVVEAEDAIDEIGSFLADEESLTIQTAAC